MSILHDALTALLSGITTYKTGTKEIWWKDDYGGDITIEVVDAETESYVEREYYPNRQVRNEYHYHSGKLQGLCKGWYNNGQLWFRVNYRCGKRYGSYEYGSPLRYYTENA